MFRTREQANKSLRNSQVSSDELRSERRSDILRLYKQLQGSRVDKRRAVLDASEEGLPLEDEGAIAAALESISLDVEHFVTTYEVKTAYEEEGIARLVRVDRWSENTIEDLNNFIPRLRSLFKSPGCEISRIVATNVVPLFIAALENPHTSAELKLRCCWVLTNIASGSYDDCFAVTPAVSLLVELISGVGVSSALQEQALWALGNLACEEGLCRGLINDGAGHVAASVASTLRWGAEGNQAVRHALWILGRLFRYPESLTHELVDLIRVEILVKIKHFTIAAAAYLQNSIHSDSPTVNISVMSQINMSQTQSQTLVEAMWLISSIASSFPFLLILDATSDDFALISRGIIPLHSLTCTLIDAGLVDTLQLDSELAIAEADVETDEQSEAKSFSDVLPASISIASLRTMSSLGSVTFKFIGARSPPSPLPPSADLPATFPFSQQWVQSIPNYDAFNLQDRSRIYFRYWTSQFSLKVIENAFLVPTLRLACKPGESAPALTASPVKRILAQEGIWTFSNTLGLVIRMFELRSQFVDSNLISVIDQNVRSMAHILKEPLTGCKLLKVFFSTLALDVRKEAAHCIANTFVFAANILANERLPVAKCDDVKEFITEAESLLSDGLLYDAASTLEQVQLNGHEDLIFGILRMIDPLCKFLGVVHIAQLARKSRLRDRMSDLEDHANSHVRNYCTVLGEALDAALEAYENGGNADSVFFSHLAHSWRSEKEFSEVKEQTSLEEDGIDFGKLFEDE